MYKIPDAGYPTKYTKKQWGNIWRNNSETKVKLFCSWIIIFSHDATAPSGPGPPHYRRLTITLRQTTLGRTPLDELSGRRWDLYLTTHNTHKRETSMPPAGFEPSVPASERRQTHALDRSATGNCLLGYYLKYILHLSEITSNFHPL